jgi:hypothetical protein
MTASVNQSATLTPLPTIRGSTDLSHFTIKSCLNRCYRVCRTEYWLRTINVGDTFTTQTPKTVPSLQKSPVVSANFADHAGPPATVADALSLPPELLDAIRNICHRCHPFSGAIAITLTDWQLNMADTPGASWMRSRRALRTASPRICTSGPIWPRRLEILARASVFDVQ